LRDRARFLKPGSAAGHGEAVLPPFAAVRLPMVSSFACHFQQMRRWGSSPQACPTMAPTPVAREADKSEADKDFSRYIGDWDLATHMTKQQWRSACRRAVGNDPGAFMGRQTNVPTDESGLKPNGPSDVCRESRIRRRSGRCCLCADLSSLQRPPSLRSRLPAAPGKTITSVSLRRSRAAGPREPLSARHIALSRLLRQSVIIPRIETASGTSLMRIGSYAERKPKRDMIENVERSQSVRTGHEPPKLH
jgi:hypothetical protein